MATLTKEEFIQEMKAKEQTAFSLLTAQTEIIMSDEKSFKHFLNMLADHVTTSVGNTILVQAQMPNATAVNSIQEWENRNISVVKDENGYYPQGIYQFMPDGYRVDENGEAHTKFKIYKGYDAKQTINPPYARSVMNEMRPISVFIGNDTADKARNIALCDSSKVRCIVYDPKKLISEAENISEDEGLKYIPETKTVVIRRVPRQEWFQRVAFEIALGLFHKEDGNDFSREARAFEAGIISYLLCRKCGIDTSNFHFDLSKASAKYSQESFRAMLNECHEMSHEMFFRLQNKLKEHNDRNRNSIESRQRKGIYV